VHWVQAYVRGIGAYLATSHPCILAKCSHDLDLVQWYAQSTCETVSSVGDLHFFKEENAPQGAADRCLDCSHKDTCIYSAKRLYIDKWHNDGEPEFAYPFNKVTIDIPHTEEKITKGLREGEYGRCAFKCNIDKVDRQMVQMTFKNGVKASLKMVFSATEGRYIVFYGTHGEIILDERNDTISVFRYGKEPEYIKISQINKNAGTHSGGDYMFMQSIYGILAETDEPLTPLNDSIECHLMGIAAEESRKTGGSLVKVHTV
jgi:predicted dehydrogenase